MIVRSMDTRARSGRSALGGPTIAATIRPVTATPGWYDDGVTPNVQRWFDGVAWSETTRPVVPVVPVAPAAPARPPVPPPPPAPSATPPAAPVAQMAWTPQSELWSAEPPSATAGYPTTGSPYRPAQGEAQPSWPAAGSPYSAAPAQPSWTAGPTAGSRTSYPSTSFGPQAFPSTSYVSAGSPQGEDHRQSAIVSGLLGIGLLVLAGVVLRFTSEAGSGRVWTWGFVAGAVLLVRGVILYVRSIRAGGRHFGPVGWAVGSIGVVTAVVVAVTSLQAAFGPMEVAVGDCFTDEGAEVQQVSCSRPHDYVVRGVVRVLNQCPASATAYTRTDDGEVACLVPDGLGTGG